MLGTVKGKTLKASDVRMNVLAQIIDGMKAVKYFAWEESFFKLIQDARNSEAEPLVRLPHPPAYAKRSACACVCACVFVCVWCACVVIGLGAKRCRPTGPSFRPRPLVPGPRCRWCTASSRGLSGRWAGPARRSAPSLRCWCTRPPPISALAAATDDSTRITRVTRTQRTHHAPQTLAARLLGHCVHPST